MPIYKNSINMLKYNHNIITRRGIVKMNEYIEYILYFLIIIGTLYALCKISELEGGGEGLLVIYVLFIAFAAFSFVIRLKYTHSHAEITTTAPYHAEKSDEWYKAAGQKMPD